jgi:hypothetical protein
MDRRDFYFRQKVTESELDGAFAAAEQADFDQFTDTGISGVTSGLDVAEASPASATEVALTFGTAYNAGGERIRVPADIAVDLSSITVPPAGNSTAVGVFVKFDRVLTDPRTDGNGLTVFFQRNESYVVELVAGGTAATPAPGDEEAFITTNGTPALSDVTRVLVADVIYNGSTTIASNFIIDTRKQWAFKLSAGSYSVNVGTAEEADQAILSIFNTYSSALDSTQVGHVPVTAPPPWSDGYGASTTVFEALEGIVTDLTTNTGTPSDSGASCVAYDGTSVPAAFTGLAAATTVQAGFDSMSTELAGSGGATIVGFTGASVSVAWADTNAATNVQSGLEGITTDLSNAAGTSGAGLVGINTIAFAVPAGLYPDVTAASTVVAALNGIKTDLVNSASTTSHGTAKIGHVATSTRDLNAYSGLTDTALDTLDTNKASLGLSNTFTANNTFDGGTHDINSATYRYNDPGHSFTYDGGVPPFQRKCRSVKISTGHGGGSVNILTLAAPAVPTPVNEAIIIEGSYIAFDDNAQDKFIGARFYLNATYNTGTTTWSFAYAFNEMQGGSGPFAADSTFITGTTSPTDISTTASILQVGNNLNLRQVFALDTTDTNFVVSWTTLRVDLSQ